MIVAQLRSIAAALAEARPGDTVEVPRGEYREQVRLKDGVTLRSRVSREPILRAAPLSSGPAVIAEGVKGARLTASAFWPTRCAAFTGILLRDSAVEIDDVEVKGAGVGIEIRGGASPALRANAIHDCLAEGILILGASTPWLSHNADSGQQGRGGGGARWRASRAARQRVRAQRARIAGRRRMR